MLSSFTAVTGGAGLLVGAAALALEGRRHRLHQAERRGDALRHFHAADRALNELDEAYRSLISVYDESDVLGNAFKPGQTLLAGPGVNNTLRRLRTSISRGGRDLQDALASLSGFVELDTSARISELSHRVHTTFESALRAESLREFLIEVGGMLRHVTVALNDAAALFGYEPTAARLTLIDDAIDRLRDRH